MLLKFSICVRNAGLLYIIAFLEVGVAQATECKEDSDCDSIRYYCDWRDFQCKQCVVCEQYNRENKSNLSCLKSVTDDCGNCTTGYEYRSNDPLNCVKTNGSVEKSETSGGSRWYYWLIGCIAATTVAAAAATTLYCCYCKKRPNEVKIPLSDSSLSHPYNPSAPADDRVGESGWPQYNGVGMYLPPYPEGYNNNITGGLTAPVGNVEPEPQFNVTARPFNPPNYVRLGDYSDLKSELTNGTELMPFLPQNAENQVQSLVEEDEEAEGVDSPEPRVQINNYSVNNTYVLCPKTLK